MQPLKAVNWLVGQYYERQAQYFLQRQGMSFVQRNISNRGGEIDLLMRDKHYWVFVEVRFRRNLRYGGALVSVTQKKRKKILTAAKLWLAQRNESFDTALCRFDICAITGQQFEWVPNAFNDDEFTH
ncbi:YraN family protein [Moellerella wisconsensis]|uniref:UPF0102 protein M992_0151 n=1 Tax=Moellerella wisconsensis ATCC 35017 TaxID=1354267 RepID=A0A0N1KJD9_9GAMM|nr:YraN family protein [Moellerella wisconsensis]KPD04454.1 putative endonuclease [Moellerella wisconsensis ATCC 35017]VFS52574.1 Uncharacterised protein family UPF0102 [Moellerella wisconsensis]